MAAFYLYNPATTINKNLIIEHFKQLGITHYSEFKLNNYNLILFTKPDMDTSNFRKNERASIFVSGSMIYKDLNYKDSITNLLTDYCNSTVDIEQIRGSNVIIIHDNMTSKITFITDPLCTKNIYFDETNKIISSNFLALIESKPFYYKLNYLALYESVISGALIPPDTYAYGVEKLCKTNLRKLEYVFSINLITANLTNKFLKFKSFNEAVEHANEQLSSYFKSLVSIDRELGSHIGLTGGFDSRLLLIHARKYLSKLNTNSFFRQNSLEYKLAKELADVLSMEFVSHENSDEVPVPNSERSFRFLDGQIRSQNFIDEPYNLPEYASFLYKDHPVGFHGCGGEQYRNAERFKRKISFSQFIKYEWLYRESGQILIDKKLENEILENIESKIREHLDFKGHKVDLLFLKRIQNEIWNPANRLTRVNALNQYFHYFVPFTEWQQSIHAYSYIDFLGVNPKFQIEMMKRIGKEELNVSTTYGYSLIEGQSVRSKILSNIASNMPRKLLLDLHRIYKSSDRHKNIPVIKKEHAFNNFYDSLNFEKAVSNSNTFHNLNALSTLKSNLKLLL